MSRLKLGFLPRARGCCDCPLDNRSALAPHHVKVVL